MKLWFTGCQAKLSCPNSDLSICHWTASGRRQRADEQRVGNSRQRFVVFSQPLVVRRHQAGCEDDQIAVAQFRDLFRFDEVGGQFYVQERQRQCAPELHQRWVLDVEIVAVALPAGVAGAQECRLVRGGGFVAHWSPHQCQRDAEDQRDGKPRETATGHGALRRRCGQVSRDFS